MFIGEGDLGNHGILLHVGVRHTELSVLWRLRRAWRMDLMRRVLARVRVHATAPALTQAVLEFVEFGTLWSDSSMGIVGFDFLSEGVRPREGGLTPWEPRFWRLFLAQMHKTSIWVHACDARHVLKDEHPQPLWRISFWRLEM